MDTTLVTGASGFIGSHLMRKLKRRGLPARGVSRQAMPGMIHVPSYGPDCDWREHLNGIRTFLVSDGDALSTHELLSTLTSAFGRKPRSIPVSPAALRLLGSLAGRRPAVERLLDSLEVDMSATRETLSWEPPLTCSTGLAATAAPR
ncbi:NAD-dependent epimerase/dehydratase family protein [Pseudorhizobium marinum]|uniref:NAD-dependent epimerase/dehydratase family protein n=1 Tax=Pseudorhizobium marinum TaxID=1496690 RepID=UPI000495CF56|nr:NAD-dependent epimerase/dehydratase family protein [Pseudorhizobium marinum]